jgi:hypothetical protein
LITRIILTTTLILCALALTACADPLSELPPQATFSGIASQPDSAKYIRVLFIHGIGIQNRSAPDTLLVHLTKALGVAQVPPTLVAPPDPSDTSPQFVRPVPIDINVDGTPAPAELYMYQFSGDGGQRLMSFGFLLWSPMTTAIKTNQLAEMNHPPRAWVNEWAKQFLHDNLSDVVLYSGTYRAKIRLAVEQALCHFVGGTPDPNMPKYCMGGTADETTAVITHSLGAYMLMDAVYDLSGDDTGVPTVPYASNASLKLLRQLNSFEWLANQLALLSLTTITDYPAISPGSVKAAQRNVYHPIRSHFLAHWQYQHRLGLRPPGAGAGGEVQRQIVAFSDPNDILSYVVSRSDIEDPQVVLNNVFIPNAETVWFNAYADPFTAHLGYLSNDTVMRMVTCGMTSGAINDCGR